VECGNENVKVGNRNELKESGITQGALLEELLLEADELVAIFSTIGKKSK
jgi:hypothetical protein